MELAGLPIKAGYCFKQSFATHASTLILVTPFAEKGYCFLFVYMFCLSIYRVESPQVSQFRKACTFTSSYYCLSKRRSFKSLRLI